MAENDVSETKPGRSSPPGGTGHAWLRRILVISTACVGLGVVTWWALHANGVSKSNSDPPTVESYPRFVDGPEQPVANSEPTRTLPAGDEEFSERTRCIIRNEVGQPVPGASVHYSWQDP